MSDDFCGIKADDEDAGITVEVLIPTRLSHVIAKKAQQAGVSFALMAGRCILAGIESERKESSKT